MATLMLQSAGSTIGAVVGQAFGPLGAVAGRALGTYAGAALDAALFPNNLNPVQGSRLTNLAGLQSSEGAYIPKIYGRARVGGQLIWTTRFDEQATLTRQGRSGGKGSSASSSSSSSSTLTYSYFGNFAIAICEGPISFVRRIWADGQELDLSLYTYRIYHGDDQQTADALICAKEGADNVPCYRGTAYVVFEQFPLAQFGNRIPQFSFEVVRSINGLATRIQSIHVIPAATEYGYSTQTLVQNLGLGVSTTENRHCLSALSDWQASLDALQALCPNLKHVSLVVSWFGDDLCAENCRILPRVESTSKSVPLMNWTVGAYNRSTAPVISSVNGQPAFGGTPCDQAVIEAVNDLVSRGFKVTFYPFVMMDIASDNQLPDPQTGAVGQPAYPWRGQIAPFVHSQLSLDQQLDQFFNGQNGSGGYSAFILHYAQLCQQFPQLDCFLLGSELVSLSHALSTDGRFPFAGYLLALLKKVRALLGPSCQLSYGADWTEYGSYVAPDGSIVDFPLDDFWSDVDVNFIGLDVYWPLSDWRDGDDHLDAQLAPSIYDSGYLRSRFMAGEAYEWYYASAADRMAQHRNSIVDGAYQKPWLFRPKDIVGWWSQPHIKRRANVETTTTSWVPQSKPIWFVEFGCPAIDRGSNAPNCFPDQKASQAPLPYFSRGFRDDFIQYRTLQACFDVYHPSSPYFQSAQNPISSLYNDHMLDASRIYVWAWDARPFPAFPLLQTVWSDGADWSTGHWLTGRLEAMSVHDLLAHLITDYQAPVLPIDMDCCGIIDGFVVDKIGSLRSVFDPLSAVFAFDICFTSGRLSFKHRQHAPIARINAQDCVVDQTNDAISVQTTPASDLPKSLSLNVSDSTFDYRSMSVISQMPVTASRRDSVAAIAILTYRAYAQQLADVWLNDVWTGRDIFSFKLSHDFLHLEIGDNIILHYRDVDHLVRINRIEESECRHIEARSIQPSIYNYRAFDAPSFTITPPALPGPAHYEVLDLALARNTPCCLQYLAVYADPWPTHFSLFTQNGQSFSFDQSVYKPANIGTTLSDFSAGPLQIIDHANQLIVTCPFALASVSELDMLGGKNVAAIRGADGSWEIISFMQAVLIAPQTYRLSGFLRGLGGQDYLSARFVAQGATFVILDDAIVPLIAGASMLGVEQRWRLGPSSRDFGDASYVEFACVPSSLALRPYAPC